jgi:hypothetical protein
MKTKPVTTVLEPKQETLEQKVEIQDSEFFNAMIGLMKQYQIQADNTEQLLLEVRRMQSLGYTVKFYTKGNMYSYEAKPKEQIGFTNESR